MPADNEEINHLKGLIKQLLDYIDYVPEGNCSCHISPPCNDCVEYSQIREVIKLAKKASEL